jgi:Subtilase family
MATVEPRMRSFRRKRRVEALFILGSCVHMLSRSLGGPKGMPLYSIGLLVCLFLFCPLARANGKMPPRGQDLPKELTVRFEEGPTSALYAEVIATLGREDLLALTVYIDRDGLAPAEILAKTGRLVGPAVPPTLNQYLCQLNPHVCTVQHEGKTTRVLWKNVKAPPNARSPGETCPDPKLPQYALCLPDISVHPYKTSLIRPYDPRRQNLKEIVVNRTGGCADLDDQCKKVIRLLNQGGTGGVDPFSPEFRGDLRLPVQAYSVTFPIVSSRHLDRLTRTLDQLISEHSREGEKLNISYTVPFSRSLKQSHRITEPPTGTEPMQEYLSPLKVMHYPYTSVADFHSAQLSSIHVGVWDLQVDKDHCDFQSQRGNAVFYPQPLPPDMNDPIMPSRASDCGSVRKQWNDKYDHATHIAGILAARFNEHGIAGVNPKAKLWAYEITGARLEKESDPILEAFENDASVSVINISQSLESMQYRSQLRRLLGADNGYQNRILFVAAAGNNGEEISSGIDCPVIPACWSDDPKHGRGIISVVALNPQGTGLLQDGADRAASNYGMAFDVAAVGESIGTFHGNHFGLMAGTSVATPYVTGLASLIYAKAGPSRHPLPHEVKQRILYTADFTDTLDGLVRFGRINFRRALNFSQDTVQIKKDLCTTSCEITGKFRRDREVHLSKGELDGVTVRTLQVKDIRRIAAEDDSPASLYWIVFVKDGELRKIRQAKFEPDTVLEYRLQGSPKPVLLNTVKDYTACSIVPHCDR